MMKESEVREKIRELVNMYVDMASKHFNRYIVPPQCEFSLSGISAGMTYTSRNAVNFNMAICMENQETFLKTTVPHEVAHIVTGQIFKYASAHGKEWKHVMEHCFGVRATRCHSYEVAHLKTRQIRLWTYVCGCSTHTVTTTIHNRMLKGTGKYKCKRCGKLISFAGEADNSQMKVA